MFGLSLDAWFYIALSFGAGLLVSDASNPSSWLRHNIRVILGVGEWSEFSCSEVLKKLPSKTSSPVDQEAQFISISLPLCLDRYTKGPLRVFCRVRPFSLDKKEFLSGAEGRYEWQQDVVGPLPAGREVDVEIAHIEKSDVSGYWGDFKADSRWIKQGSAYLVDVEVRTGLRKQNKRFMLKVHRKNPSWNEEQRRLDPGGLFSIYENDRGPLDDVPKTTN